MNPEAPVHIRYPLMLQTWESLTFLHWPVDAGAVRRLVPSSLEVDLFEGAAWVSLVPFLIRGLRVPGTPAIPWVSTFPETNVRTYVRDARGERGVWFFSLDADRLLAVLGARAGFFLPYFWARMRVEGQHYRSERVWPGPVGAFSDIVIQPGEEMTPDALTVFLTARFRLYTRVAGIVMYGQIEHAPWRLRRARVERLDETLVQAAGLARPEQEPLVQYSESIDVRFGYLQRA